MSPLQLKLANSDLKMLVSVLSENLPERRTQVMELLRAVQFPISPGNRIHGRRSQPANSRSKNEVTFSLNIDILTIEIMTEDSSGVSISDFIFNSL